MTQKAYRFFMNLVLLQFLSAFLLSIIANALEIAEFLSINWNQKDLAICNAYRRAKNGFIMSSVVRRALSIHGQQYLDRLIIQDLTLRNSSWCITNCDGHEEFVLGELKHNANDGYETIAETSWTAGTMDLRFEDHKEGCGLLKNFDIYPNLTFSRGLYRRKHRGSTFLDIPSLKKIEYDRVPNHFTESIFSRKAAAGIFGEDQIELSYEIPESLVSTKDPQVIVAFSYNGEAIVETHLRYLYDVVDKFIIVEAWETHSGSRKEFLFIERHQQLFLPFLKKIQFIVITAFPEAPVDRADLRVRYEHTKDTSSWFREEYQRDIVAEYLKEHMPREEFILLVVDSDEVVNHYAIQTVKKFFPALTVPMYFGLTGYFYNFQWHSTVPWTPAFAINNYGIAGNFSLSQFRTMKQRAYVENAGWHCTYCTSLQDIQRKILSFGHTEYQQEKYLRMRYLREVVWHGFDLYGRDQIDDKFRLYRSRRIDELPSLLRGFHERLLTLQGSPMMAGSNELEVTMEDVGETAHLPAGGELNAVLYHTPIFITFLDMFFVETAEGLYDALVQCGFVNVHLMGEFNLTQYLILKEENMLYYNDTHPLLQISIGTHVPAYYTKHLILFHVENTWDSFLDLDIYKFALHRASAVWTYSSSLIAYIRSLGYGREIVEMPLYGRSVYYEAYLDRLKKNDEQQSDGVAGTEEEMVFYRYREGVSSYGSKAEVATEAAVAEDSSRKLTPLLPRRRKIDQSIYSEYEVLMAHTSSPRRAEFVRNLLHYYANNSSVRILSTEMVSNMDRLDLFDVFSKETLIGLAKVVVNIHQHENSALEVHRINHLLSLGKCVISERSTTDPALDTVYDGAVVFVDMPDIPLVLNELLGNDELRRKFEVAALKRYRLIQRNTAALKKSIVSVLTARQR